MKINNSGYVPNLSNSFSGIKAEQAASAQKQNAAKINKVSVPSRMDTIVISNQKVNSGSSLSKVRDQIVSDLNADKSSTFLENLKKQVNSGEYKIDSKKLAEIMLTGEKE